jgi:hypothetical protein
MHLPALAAEAATVALLERVAHEAVFGATIRAVAAISDTVALHHRTR